MKSQLSKQSLTVAVLHFVALLLLIAPARGQQPAAGNESENPDSVDAIAKAQRPDYADKATVDQKLGRTNSTRPEVSRREEQLHCAGRLFRRKAPGHSVVQLFQLPTVVHRAVQQLHRRAAGPEDPSQRRFSSRFDQPRPNRKTEQGDYRPSGNTWPTTANSIPTRVGTFWWGTREKSTRPRRPAAFTTCTSPTRTFIRTRRPSFSVLPAERSFAT